MCSRGSIKRRHGLPHFGPGRRKVAVAMVMYALSAWWGLTNAVDRQRVDAFFRRSIRRSGYCSSDLPSFAVMCEQADQQLFQKIVANPNQMLHNLLPPPTVASQNYNLRHRSHDRQIKKNCHHIGPTGRLTDYTFTLQRHLLNLNSNC